MPSIISVLPFVVLLLLIALGPLLFKDFWHKRYPFISVILALVVGAYYIFSLSQLSTCIHELSEYITFISLLAALYFASGGIVIKTDERGTVKANVYLLIIGAILASVVGTTGAAMILIRPFINMNKNRLEAYQKVFFIFIVCNAGGCLSPIGDPPLFLGFLKGIPFFWISVKAFPFWLLSNSFLIAVFYYIDKTKNKIQVDHTPGSIRIKVEGMRNIFFLILAVFAVFIDPNIAGLEFIPSINFHGQHISFVREIVLLLICWLSFIFTDKALLKKNEFSLEPIREVAFVFFGLFMTMMPALQWMSHIAAMDAVSALLNQHSFYWSTGILSAVLDNAPTYLNAMSAALGAKGLDINQKADVLQYIAAPSFVNVVSISIAAVFFGAFTYLGNAPNFMVKAIAEQRGVKMPSFFAYIFRFAIPILLPMLLLNWLLLYLLY